MGTREEIAAALADIDTEIAEAEERLEALRLDRRGAEAFLRRLRLPAGDAPSTSPAESPTRISGTGNTAIVASILSDYPDGLHLADIEARTAERGTPLDNEQVRGAVTYLKRVSRAERRGRGVWRLISTSAEATSEAPKVASVLPDLRPVGGDASETGLDDHRDDLQGRNGGHPTGAPIVG